MSKSLSTSYLTSHNGRMNTLGSVIADYRRDTGATQAELAERIGTSPAYLSQIENGKVAFPNADLRRRIAGALRIRHIDLLVAAGELSAEEVPGPSQPVRNLNDPVELLCDQISQLDLRVDNRAVTLSGMLGLWAEQDRSRRAHDSARSEIPG